MRSPELDIDWEYAEPGYIQFSIAGEGAESIDCEDIRLGLLAGSFQDRVGKWLEHCFGESTDPLRRERRAHRFVEEALEFAQSVGTTWEDAIQLVDYVFSRPVGEPAQEVGGVMLTLMGAASANGLKVPECAEKELARVWEKADEIRAKNARQVNGSPLPGDDGKGAAVEIDPRTGRKLGDHGTPFQAIEFATSNYSIMCQEREFLKDWLEGNLDGWSEFYEWLEKEEAK
jgi:hypothetical protein